MTPNQIAFEFRAAFEDTQGWMIGHTAFKNGWHGDGWLEKGVLVRDPARLYTLLKHQANAIKKHFPQTELIVGIPACGAVVASFVAAHLELPLALTIPVQENLEFHRMHVPPPGLKAVIVDDLIFSGSDARAHLRFLSDHGLEVLGISAWVSRVGTELDGVPLATLMPAPFQTFSAANCPLCLKAETIRWQDIRE
jgi:orotate phosphoribosyltransferase